MLDSVLYRVGLLAALRSKKLGGQVIGVMVTASHNPEKVRRSPVSDPSDWSRGALSASGADSRKWQDNGVKLVDPAGEMLHASWESHATTLANASTSAALVSALEAIVDSASINLSVPAVVVYGHDTRPSCPALVQALEDGLRAMGAELRPAGLVTTPQLHYLVKCYNTAGTKEAYGEPTEQGYYDKLASAYTTLAVRFPFLARNLSSSLP